jgi:chaperone required for assembly of F1-ATPase
MEGLERGTGGNTGAIRGQKRFYRAVTIEPVGSGFAVNLDERPLLTPARRRFEVPTRALAELAAGEWRRQGDHLDITGMVVNRLINTGLDRVAGDMAGVRAEIEGYARSDLLCYRAEAPASLIEAQALAWDPVIDWAAETLGARFVITSGIVYVAQPPTALYAVGEALASYGSIGLAALATMTALTGSLILALATARGHLSPADAWARAHVDEDYQALHWGMDGEAAERRRRRYVEMEAACQVVSCLAS